jgi:hypothetical protein
VILIVFIIAYVFFIKQAKSNTPLEKASEPFENISEDLPLRVKRKMKLRRSRRRRSALKPKFEHKPVSKAKTLSEIIDEFVDPDYDFNFQVLPEVTRKYNPSLDQKYIDQIATNVKEWDPVGKSEALQILPEQIRETGHEFIIKTRIHAKISDEDRFLWAEYYGQMQKADDYLEGGQDACVLQLIELRPMPKQNFYTGLKLDEAPFMTMSEQMHHVRDRLDILMDPI